MDRSQKQMHERSFRKICTDDTIYSDLKNKESNLNNVVRIYQVWSRYKNMQGKDASQVVLLVALEQFGRARKQNG